MEEPPKEGTLPESPKTIEESAKETLSQMYVLGEEFLLDSTMRQMGARRDTGDSLEDLRRVQYEIGTEQTQFRNQTSDIGEQIVLLFVPEEDKRNAIREAALNAAKDFWTKKLETPDTPPDAVILGRRRITQISQKLEEFSKPPENP